MLFAVAAAQSDWDRLQESPHPGGLEPTYRVLLSALDTGWKIQAPVYLRARWDNRGPRVYHFVLHHASPLALRLLTVAESPEVARFVRQEGLEVVAG